MLLMVALSISAQYRDVKMPEAPKKSNYRNYGMENSGFWCAVDAEGGSSIMVNSKNMQYTALSFTGG